MTTVGFSLGVMGMPMVTNLLAAAHPVMAGNRTANELYSFAKTGGAAASNVTDAAGSRPS
jgi:3-hydroxyisobutyrate dehydrogenase-like beta-hydroxyacid dehydrogenase